MARKLTDSGEDGPCLREEVGGEKINGRKDEGRG
jgi:hypothetical protein